MTVKRQHAETFRVSCSRMQDAIREVLAEGHPSHSYQSTEVTEDGRRFTTRVKPWQSLFLTTRMSIDLDPDDKATRVTVRTRSQWFILGDVFNMYGGYIRDMLQSIHNKLRAKAEPSAAADGGGTSAFPESQLQ